MVHSPTFAILTRFDGACECWDISGGYIPAQQHLAQPTVRHLWSIAERRLSGGLPGTSHHYLEGLIVGPVLSSGVDVRRIPHRGARPARRWNQPRFTRCLIKPTSQVMGRTDLPLSTPVAFRRAPRDGSQRTAFSKRHPTWTRSMWSANGYRKAWRICPRFSRWKPTLERTSQSLPSLASQLGTRCHSMTT